jgi:hypothetical protein
VATTNADNENALTVRTITRPRTVACLYPTGYCFAMEPTEVARSLAAADELRIRRLRAATIRIVCGVALLVGAWLTLPLGLYQIASTSMSVLTVVEILAGFVLLVAGVAVILRGLRMRREALRSIAPEAMTGRANPAFDEDRKSLPTGGVPHNWIGNVPGM